MIKRILIFMLVCLLIPIINAEIQSLTPQIQGACIQIVQSHSNITSINVTKISYPPRCNYPDNYTVIPMTTVNNINYYYSFCNTTCLGYYTVSTCGNGDGIKTCVDYNFEVTVNGQSATTANASFYYGVIFIFVIVLSGGIYLSWKIKKSWAKMLFASISYLSFVIITFIIWQVCVNFISGISFIPSITFIIWIISMAGFLPFIIIMGLYILNLEAKELEVTTKIKMGYSEDEARNGMR